MSNRDNDELRSRCAGEVRHLNVVGSRHVAVRAPLEVAHSHATIVASVKQDRENGEHPLLCTHELQGLVDIMINAEEIQYRRLSQLCTTMTSSRKIYVKRHVLWITGEGHAAFRRERTATPRTVGMHSFLRYRPTLFEASG